MDEKKIKEIFSDEEFVKSLLALETPEEVQAALKEKDIDLTVDQIMKVHDLLVRKQNGELTEDDLENVSGGLISAVAFGIIFGISAILGIGGEALASSGSW